MTIVRPDGRQPDQLRPVRITPKYLPHAEGSALIELGPRQMEGRDDVDEPQPREAAL